MVGSSSPPSPTTQSYANRDFPVHCELPRISGLPCVHVVSAEGHSNLSRLSGAFVSGRQFPFPGNRDCGSQRFGSNAEERPTSSRRNSSGKDKVSETRHFVAGAPPGAPGAAPSRRVRPKPCRDLLGRQFHRMHRGHAPYLQIGEVKYRQTGARSRHQL